MVAHVLAGAVVTFIVLRIGAQWDADRYLRYALAALAAVAVVASRLAGDDTFTAGYWAIGFVFGVALHYWVPTRRHPSKE